MSKARPCDIAWIRSAVEQCKAAGVPCFVKQLGARPRFDPSRDPQFWREGMGPGIDGASLRDRKGGDPEEWPEDLRVREFPQGE